MTPQPNASKLPTACYLCGKSLLYGHTNAAANAQKLPTTPDTHDLAAKSEMHYGHVSGSPRSRQQFAELPQSAWDLMGVKEKRGSVSCCYECHEVLLHNIVFSEDMLSQLAPLMNGKSFAERAVLLNRLIAAGLKYVTSGGSL